MLSVSLIAWIVALFRYRAAAERSKEFVVKDHHSKSTVEGPLQKTESVHKSHNRTTLMSKIDVLGNEWTRYVYRFCSYKANYDFQYCRWNNWKKSSITWKIYLNLTPLDVYPASWNKIAMLKHKSIVNCFYFLVYLNNSLNNKCYFSFT